LAISYNVYERKERINQRKAPNQALDNGVQELLDCELKGGGLRLDRNNPFEKKLAAPICWM
jgi:hypothetical protein